MVSMICNRCSIHTYVKPETYEILTKERGEASLSKLVCTILEEYAEFVLTDEQTKYGESENIGELIL